MHDIRETISSPVEYVKLPSRGRHYKYLWTVKVEKDTVQKYP